MRKITSYNIRDHRGSFYEFYPVQSSVFGYGRRSYFVDVDLPNQIYNCQCCKINRDGILCCHVMKVMSHLGEVHKYPEHYILPRWCIPPPDIDVPLTEPREIPSGKLPRKEMRMLRYGNLCSDFAKVAVGAAASENTDEVARKHMHALEKELAMIKKAAADALKKKKGIADAKRVASNGEGVQTDDAGMSTTNEGTAGASNSTVQDPLRQASAGRPRQKRMKGALHLQPSRRTACSVCSSFEHDARNCPVRLANPERYPLLALFQ